MGGVRGFQGFNWILEEWRAFFFFFEQILVLVLSQITRLISCVAVELKRLHPFDLDQATHRPVAFDRGPWRFLAFSILLSRLYFPFSSALYTLHPKTKTKILYDTLNFFVRIVPCDLKK